MNCDGYGRKNISDWKKIYENDCENEEKIEIALEAKNRAFLRNQLQEDGRTSAPSGSQGSNYC